MNKLKSITLNHFLIAVILATIFSLTACKDNDDNFKNLNSTLTQESILIGATEGNYLIFNLGLQKALSEDLIINVTFSTEGVNAYINENDYTQGLEYSSDGGQNWFSESDKTKIRFKARTTNLKARISTKDDSDIEVTEEFKLILAIDNANNVNISNTPENISCVVYDNDLDEKNNQNPLDVLMVFSIDNKAKTYERIGITTSSLPDTKAKEILDGEYKKIVEDVLNVLNLAKNIKVKKFELLYDHESGLGGAVYNESAGTGTGENNWVMILNTAFAYSTEGADSTSQAENSYNRNGLYGSILTHEFGHILTLNYLDQLDDTAGSTIPCMTYVSREGCAKSTSHLYNFYTSFYETPTTNLPTHVSEYAYTNIEEDIAESFAFYVCQENVPVSTASSSGALQKMNFIGQRTLGDLKDDIRKIITTKIVSPDTEHYAYRHHLDEDGKPISCREMFEKFKASRANKNN